MQPENPHQPGDGPDPSVRSTVGDPGPPSPPDPETYNAIVAEIVPVDVRLVDLNFRVKGPTHSGFLKATAELATPELVDRSLGEGENHYYQVHHSSTFTIASPDGTIAAEGRAVFSVRLRVGFEPPDQFWSVFLRRNLKLYTYPALRDLVASLAARSSLVVEPLGSIAVLPTLKVSEASGPKPTLQDTNPPESETQS